MVLSLVTERGLKCEGSRIVAGGGCMRGSLASLGLACWKGGSFSDW